MNMQYPVFCATAALGLFLIWKNVTGKISYDLSFGVGLALLPVGMVVSLAMPEYRFLYPLAITFLVLVPVVWVFDAGSAPVARFVDDCLAADNPARERNARWLLGGLIWTLIILVAVTSAYRAWLEDSVPAVIDFLILLALPFLGVCLARIGIRVIRYFDEISEEEGL